MSATKKEPQFKVGDRVRVGERHYRFKSIGQREGTVVSIDGGFEATVEFKGWTGGWSEAGTPCNRWGFDNEAIVHLIAVSSSLAAKFQVVYIEDGDETFDTQEAAEAHAYDLARNEPGSKFAVFKRIATATTGAVAIERFA